MKHKFIGKNILILASSRSGHHAVVNWLIQQSIGVVKFYNNCDRGWVGGKLLPKQNVNGPTKGLVEVIYISNDNTLTSIYTIEDFDMNKCKTYDFFNGEETHKYKIDLVIIINRDLQNWIASRVKGGGIGERSLTNIPCTYYAAGRVITKMEFSVDEPTAIQKWGRLIKESLGETNYLEDGEVYNINFNNWYSEKNYRKKICKDLGLGFSDKGLNELNKAGGGSSFTGMDITNARNLDVLHRYYLMSEDKRYQEIMREIPIETFLLNHKYFNKNMG